MGTGERLLPKLGTVPTKASWKWRDLRGGGHMGGSAFWVGEHRGGAVADTEPSVSASYVEGRTTGLCVSVDLPRGGDQDRLGGGQFI